MYKQVGIEATIFYNPDHVGSFWSFREGVKPFNDCNSPPISSIHMYNRRSKPAQIQKFDWNRKNISILEIFPH